MPGSGFQNVSRVIVSPNYVNDSTVFVFNGGVYRSTNANAVPAAVLFQDISIPTGPNNAYHSVSNLVVSPNYASDHALFAGTGQGLFRFLNASASVVSWQRVDNALVSESFSGGSGYYPPFALSPASQPTRRSLWNRIIAVLSRYIEALMPSQ